MTQLDLQHNELERLPESIGHLALLKRLGIRYNHLHELPSTLAQCTLLDEFVVESNKLQALPVNFYIYLVNLNIYLNFKGRNFVCFAKFEKYKFESKSIECNSTGRIRNGSGNFDKNNAELIPNLQSVNVEHNSIGKVPFGIFAKAIQLSKLNFKENELTAFPLDFGTWLPLTELNVSNNEIQELPAGKLFKLN